MHENYKFAFTIYFLATLTHGIIKSKFDQIILWNIMVTHEEICYLGRFLCLKLKNARLFNKKNIVKLAYAIWYT